MKDIDLISGDVLDVALRLHRDLGPGLLESAYEALMAARLAAAGYNVLPQHAVSVEFDGIRIENPYRSTDRRASDR